MSIHGFNQHQYVPVTTFEAVTELTAVQRIFLGDTHHYSQKTQGAVIETFCLLADAGRHADACFEHNTQEVAGRADYVRQNWQQLKGSTLAQLDYTRFCALDIPALAARQGNPDFNAMLLSMAALALLVAARQRETALHAVDLADKDNARSLKHRLARDAEVAGNIRDNIGDRPFICIYGSAHLQPAGLPQHFPKGQSARLWVYGDRKEFRQSVLEQTINLWTGDAPTAPPDYMYWGAERQFFRRRTPTPLWRTPI